MKWPVKNELEGLKDFKPVALRSESLRSTTGFYEAEFVKSVFARSQPDGSVARLIFSVMNRISPLSGEMDAGHRWRPIRQG